MRGSSVLGRILPLPLALAATPSLSNPVDIGRATTVVPLATNETEGVLGNLEPGSHVFQDGIIRTFKIGAAGIEFIDKTTLTVYPNSSVKLDQFVFNPDRTVKEVVINFLKGAFRLVSGGPRTSETYRLVTPHVNLGIRGTILHIVSDDDSTIVQALHGAFSGCSSTSNECRLVLATDYLNAARFWANGRVELLRSSPNLGVRQAASGGGSLDPTSSSIAIGPSVSLNPEASETPLPFINTGTFGIIPSVSSFLNEAAPTQMNTAQGPTQSAHPICFTRGTLILTPDGERPIEDLRVGDHIVTSSGAPEKVRWIPKQVYTRRQGRAWDWMVAPIRVARNALATDIPNRDLILSRYHAISFSDVLIEAKCLVNGASIRRFDYPGYVLEYFNLELDGHKIIYANGVPVESYAPADERARESCINFPEYHRLYPGREYRQYTTLSPRLGPGGRRSELISRLKSLISPVYDCRGELEIIRDRLAIRGQGLARAS